MPNTKIYVSNPKIGFFTVNKNDKIIDTGDKNRADWDKSYVEMDKSKMNNEIYISFNKRENEKLGKDPVYSPILNCIITKIETL